jgi:hypothetical protein
MLAEIAESLLGLGARQSVVRPTSVEMLLPVDVRVRSSHEGLVFCADVPSWRWRTDWDPPFAQLRFTLEPERQELA